MYFSYVRPILEYAVVIWDNCPNYIKENLNTLTYETARIITKLTSMLILLQDCGWETLEERRLYYFTKLLTKQFPNIYPI